MGSTRSSKGRLATIGVLVCAGVLIGASTARGRGVEARPGRQTDLPGLVRAARDHGVSRTRELAALRADVDSLSRAKGGTGPATSLERIELAAGIAPVSGPGVQVTLKDAPPDVKPVGVNQDLLVVHQQDIQAVANALWAGGAEAMTIQGQRVVATTGIKCVGNTVVVHGIPYAPPYVLVAIGNVGNLQSALEDSSYLKTYRDQALAYQLGYAVVPLPTTRLDGFSGRTDLRFAMGED